MKQGKGLPVFSGVAIGPAVVYRKSQRVLPVSSGDPQLEQSKFDAARETARQQLSQLYEKAKAELGEDKAAIVEVQMLMLDDLDYLDGVADAIAGGAAAVCAFLCGVTEPFEFAFMFLAFPLYVVYAALYGIFASITVALGFRAGFCFSAGATDLLFGASLPAAANYWVMIPMGLAALVVFYLVFRFAITKWNLKTPGREDDVDSELKIELANDDYTTMAQIILEGVGGKENLTSIDHCITRLRLEVKDRLLVDEKKIKSSGASGVIRPGKTSVQVVIGPKVQFVFDEFKKLAK